ncbi:MAG: hypothetical protein AAAC47_28130 [Pararhizobium sp.]
MNVAFRDVGAGQAEIGCAGTVYRRYAVNVGGSKEHALPRPVTLIVVLSTHKPQVGMQIAEAPFPDQSRSVSGTASF